MPHQRTSAVLVMATFLSSALWTAGAQEGLYDPTPPSDSAFVRMIGAPAGVLGTRAVTAAKGGASAYVVVPQGEFTARLGALSGKLRVDAGKFYTVILHGGKLNLLADAPAENRAKALLTVYNLSKAPSVDLKTADGKTAVVSGVKPGESGSRAVNGITVDLAAFDRSRALGTLRGVKLGRGNAYALVVTDAGMTLTTSSTQTR